MRNVASGDSEEELLVLVPVAPEKTECKFFCERHERAVERVKSPRAFILRVVAGRDARWSRA